MTSRGNHRHDDVIKSRDCAMMSLRLYVITSQDDFDQILDSFRHGVFGFK